MLQGHLGGPLQEQVAMDACFTALFYCQAIHCPSTRPSYRAQRNNSLYSIQSVDIYIYKHYLKKVSNVLLFRFNIII